MPPTSSRIRLFFVCKECREQFHKVSDFIEHKKEEHFATFKKINCIVFEESRSYQRPRTTQSRVKEERGHQNNNREDVDNDSEAHPQRKFDDFYRNLYQNLESRTKSKSGSHPHQDVENDYSEPNNENDPQSNDESHSGHGGDDDDQDGNSQGYNHFEESSKTQFPSNPYVIVAKLTSTEIKNATSAPADSSGVVIKCDPDDFDFNTAAGVNDDDVTSYEGSDFEHEDQDQDEEALLPPPPDDLRPPTENNSFHFFQLSSELEARATTPMNSEIQAQTEHKCSLCDRKFSSEPQLKIHVGICSLYHKDRNRFCIPCNHIFSGISNLERHKLTKLHKMAIEGKIGLASSTLVKKNKNKNRHHSSKTKIKTKTKTKTQTQTIPAKVGLGREALPKIPNKLPPPKQQVTVSKKNANRFCVPCNRMLSHPNKLKRHQLTTLHKMTVEGKLGSISFNKNPLKAKTVPAKLELEKQVLPKIPEALPPPPKTEGRVFDPNRDGFCASCNKSFRSLYDLKRHRLTTIHKIMSSEGKLGLKNNIREALKKRPRKPKPKPKSSILLPMGSHVRCHICKKPFSSRKAVTTHLVSHSEERPFKCPHSACSKKFKTKRVLQRHLLETHANLRPFACTEPNCMKTYKRREELTKHLVTHMNTSGH